ncbi:MAG: tail tape measure protein [Novosphingobium sp.]|nr:tail tape measure protein [Novosphingobium sp.]
MTPIGDDPVDSLLIDVRASTKGFEQDIATMRGAIDGNLLDGFARAGNVLERGLLGAIRRGSLGFDDLKRVALNTVNEIAAQAVQGLIGGSGGLGGALNLGSLVGSILGLPGRATGGIVAPDRGYLVGEKGPELFVPASAGRVEPFDKAGLPQAGRTPVTPAAPATLNSNRDVRVSINVVSPKGSSTPRSLQRSSRQVASAVRRALAYN